MLNIQVETFRIPGPQLMKDPASQVQGNWAST
jgi:hypothetical protein